MSWQALTSFKGTAAAKPHPAVNDHVEMRCWHARASLLPTGFRTECFVTCEVISVSHVIMKPKIFPTLCVLKMTKKNAANEIKYNVYE